MLMDSSGTAITIHRGSLVRNISDVQLKAILDYLAGGVRTWCKARPREQFALRDLFGGENYYWTGTPLQALYDKYEVDGCSSDEAVTRAGRDAGRLLKRVLIEDATRVYVQGYAGRANGYCLTTIAERAHCDN